MQEVHQWIPHLVVVVATVAAEFVAGALGVDAVVVADVGVMPVAGCWL
jgi:hypothetical protein